MNEHVASLQFWMVFVLPKNVLMAGLKTAIPFHGLAHWPGVIWEGQ